MHKSLFAITFATALVAGASFAFAQNSYTPGTTETFNDTTTYPGGDYLTGGQIIPDNPSGPGHGGWVTNDPENDSLGGTAPDGSNEYVGGSNYIVRAADNKYGTGGQAVFIGGLNRNQPINNSATTLVPGMAVSNVNHGVTLAPGAQQGYQLDVDAAILSQNTKLNNMGQSRNFLTDSFAFVLGNGTNPLLAINFKPTTDATNIDRVDFGSEVRGGGNNRSGNGVLLNSTFHLTIKIDTVNNTFTASYSQISNGMTFTAQIASGSLSGTGIAANAVNNIAAQWSLATATKDGNGGYSTASTDTLLFDNLQFSYFNVVPEPSTYAACVVGLFALFAVAKARRRAC